MSSTAAETAPLKPKSVRHSFMLHDPVNMEAVSKYSSSHARYAALKAASAGVKRIILRRTNSKICRVYEGDIVDLPEPKVIKRGDREITYKRKPTVRFTGETFVYDGVISPDEDQKSV